MKKETDSHLVDALLILDGWGINPVSTDTDNAVTMADLPFLNMLETTYPCSRLLCSGSAVGLPDGIMGNSEVGHMNIGAGRKVFQNLVRINNAIADQSFFAIPTLVRLMQKLKQEGNSLHLMGLLSDGGVHSHISHLFALIDMACDAGIKKIYIHPILDGRDTPQKSGIQYLTQLQAFLKQKGKGKIATLCGRFYAMDRDTRWNRVEAAYNLYTRGVDIPSIAAQGVDTRQKTKIHNTDPLEALMDAYASGQTDEFIKPIYLLENDKGGEYIKNCKDSKDSKESEYSKNSRDNRETNDSKACPHGSKGLIRDNDGIIFFNFRADRAREIARALTENKETFTEFERKTILNSNHFLCMTRYDESFDFPVIFDPQHLDNILGEIISQNALPQLRIAETEKYAHVTYFFNGGDEKIFPMEERILIPSPRDVKTYDEKPEMSAHEVADKTCEMIRKGKFRFIALNFANMDMVGHTGNFDAAVKACTTVDACVKKVVEAVWETGGTAMVTADHGNAEQMKDSKGNPHTTHTLNPVRFILAGRRYLNTPLKDGILGDIAPTILKVMGLKQPAEMTGKALFQAK